MTMEATPGRPRIISARGAILTMILAAMLFSSVYPLRRYFAVRNEIVSLEREEQRLDVVAADLEGQKVGLDAPAEIERRAREELGYVRPGEVPFVVVPKAPKAPPAPSGASGTASAASSSSESFLARWWEAMRRIVGSAN